MGSPMVVVVGGWAVFAVEAEDPQGEQDVLQGHRGESLPVAGRVRLMEVGTTTTATRTMDRRLVMVGPGA